MKIIVIYLKRGNITYTIGEYLNYKIKKLYDNLSYRKKQDFQRWIDESIGKLMEQGMFYYSGGNIQNYKNIIEKELNCFLNLIKISRNLLNFTSGKYFMKYVNILQLEKYIKYSIVKFNSDKKYKKESGMFNLSRMYLENIDLIGMDLSGLNFRTSNLTGAKLQKAYLINADLQGADLQKVNLRGANLERANLKGANLDSAYLYDANLQRTNLTDANLTKVYLNGAIINNANLYNAKLGIMVLSYIYSFDFRVLNIENSLIYIEEKDEYINYKEFLDSEYNHLLDE